MPPVQSVFVFTVVNVCVFLEGGTGVQFAGACLLLLMLWAILGTGLGCCCRYLMTLSACLVFLPSVRCMIRAVLKTPVRLDASVRIWCATCIDLTGLLENLQLIQVEGRGCPRRCSEGLGACWSGGDGRRLVGVSVPEGAIDEIMDEVAKGNLGGT